MTAQDLQNDNNTQDLNQPVLPDPTQQSDSAQNAVPLQPNQSQPQQPLPFQQSQPLQQSPHQPPSPPHQQNAFQPVSTIATTNPPTNMELAAMMTAPQEKQTISSLENLPSAEASVQNSQETFTPQVETIAPVEQVKSPEIEPSMESKVGEEKEKQKKDDSFSTFEKSEPNVVDKRPEETHEPHKLDTTDKLTLQADKDEEEFILSVLQEHGNN